MPGRVFALGLLLIAALLNSQSAFGARIISDEKGNHIRLTDEPCVSTAGIFATMTSRERPSFRRADIYWDGKGYAACWTDLGDGTVFVIDEEGDNANIDKRALKEEVQA